MPIYSSDFRKKSVSASAWVYSRFSSHRDLTQKLRFCYSYEKIRFWPKKLKITKMAKIPKMGKNLGFRFSQFIISGLGATVIRPKIFDLDFKAKFRAYWLLKVTKTSVFSKIYKFWHFLYFSSKTAIFV